MYLTIQNTNVRVLGTAHLFPADSPSVPNWVVGAYGWAQDIVIEQDAKEVLEGMRIADGAVRDPLLTAAQIATITSHWNIALGRLEEYKLWAIALLAPIALLQPVGGVEEHVKKWAARDLKKLGILESAAEFVGLLDQVPAAVFAKEIDFYLNHQDIAKSRFLAIHSAWLSRDIERLYSVVRELPPFQVPELHHAILAGRNRIWLPRILSRLESRRRTLVLVGALHLCGNGSVVELLGKEGHLLIPL